MEMITGCFVFAPPQTPEPTEVGPAETDEQERGPPFGEVEGLGDRELAVEPGSVVVVPRGMPHTVWNSGEDAVRGLIIISPGDAEHVFVPVDAG